jgi:transposase
MCTNNGKLRIIDKSYQIRVYNRGMRRLKITMHDSVAELAARYRGAKDGVARSQWQIVWLLVSGQPTRTVAETTGYSEDWIRQIAHRYSQSGASGIGDGRHRNPGRMLSLSRTQQNTLKALLSAAAERGERWSGVQVAAWMSEQVGRTVYAQRGWEMLRRLGFRPKVGRPRHVKANAAEQAAYKKRS